MWTIEGLRQRLGQTLFGTVPSESFRASVLSLSPALRPQLIHMMGGRIWLGSEPGKGSAFHFTAVFDAPSPGVGEAPAEPLTLEGVRVLAVDDNATNRRILEELLTRWRTRAHGG